MTPSRARASAWSQALQDVGLDPETRFRYPHEFSGGQRQRIAVARAMVLEPTFIVLDEPTSALDMLIQAQMVDLLRDLQKRRNLTYLFISHDLRVVAALASRLMVMRDGKVVEEGPAGELFENPKSDYTRALFAAAFNLETAPKASSRNSWDSDSQSFDAGDVAARCRECAQPPRRSARSPPPYETHWRGSACCRRARWRHGPSRRSDRRAATSQIRRTAIACRSRVSCM